METKRKSHLLKIALPDGNSKSRWSAVFDILMVIVAANSSMSCCDTAYSTSCVHSIFPRPCSRLQKSTWAYNTALWPWGRLSLSQKWVPGIFPDGAGGGVLPVPGADNVTTFICRLPGNLGTSTPWNPQGLSRPVMGLLCLYNTVPDAHNVILCDSYHSPLNRLLSLHHTYI
jgi:hypothetical protein